MMVGAFPAGGTASPWDGEGKFVADEWIAGGTSGRGPSRGFRPTVVYRRLSLQGGRRCSSFGRHLLARGKTGSLACFLRL